MTVRRRPDTGKWFYRKIVKLPNGEKSEVTGQPTINTKQAALDAERDAVELEIARVRFPEQFRPKKEVPTFSEWFWGPDPEAEEPAGKFWPQWVEAEGNNKQSERRSKKQIYQLHLKPKFGDTPLDEIDEDAIASFRAELKKKPGIREGQTLGVKRINNIVAVLSKALRWAEQVRVIERAPRIRFSPGRASRDRVLQLRRVRAPARGLEGHRPAVVRSSLFSR